jgi:hypothetical protein
VDFLLVHGSTQSPRGYDRLAEALEQRGHRTVRAADRGPDAGAAVDAPGGARAAGHRGGGGPGWTLPARVPAGAGRGAAGPLRQTAVRGELRRRQGGSGATGGGGAPDAGAHLVHSGLDGGRERAREGRVLPAGGRVQVPRGVQRDRGAGSAGPRPRRADLLLGEPRAGHRAGGEAARRPGHDRDATRRAADEGRRHGRVRRRAGPVRPLHPAPRGSRRPSAGSRSSRRTTTRT